jgi:hypothetical protein
MKVGDLIYYLSTPHVVVSIEQSVPVARRGLEAVVLKDTTTLETRTLPMKWIRR